MQSTIYAELVFCNFDYDSDEITAKLGLEPTRVRRIGDIVGNGLYRRKENAWMLRSRIESIDLDEHVKDVLVQIRPCQAKVMDISRTCETLIACAVSVRNDESVIISFDSGTLGQIAALNASLDIDYYDFSNVTREGAGA